MTSTWFVDDCKRFKAAADRASFIAETFLECAKNCSNRWEHTPACHAAFQQINSWKPKQAQAGKTA